MPISDIVDLKDKSSISEVLGMFTTKLSQLKKDFNSGKKIPELSEYHKLDEMVIYNILYDGLSDALDETITDCGYCNKSNCKKRMT